MSVNSYYAGPEYFVTFKMFVKTRRTAIYKIISNGGGGKSVSEANKKRIYNILIRFLLYNIAFIQNFLVKK